MVSKLGKIAALGLGIVLGVNQLAESQDSGQYLDRWEQEYYSASEIPNQYRTINAIMNEGERLRDLQPKLRSEYLPHYGHKLERILNETRPLSQGDRVVVIESQTPDGIYYPYYVNLDYANPDKKDLELIASMVPTEEDAPFRFTLNYYDFDGKKYMTLWNNRERPGFFQAEGPYPNIAQFILPGTMDDYRITSYFGDRTDPFLGENSGGSATQYHPAIDLAMANRNEDIFGTDILAPMDGFVRFGYVQKENTNDNTIEDEKSIGRYIEFKSEGRERVLLPDGNLRNTSVGYLFYHSRAGSADLVRRAMPEGVVDWWWIRTLSNELNSDFDEEDLIENIRNNYNEGRLNSLGIITEWIPVTQGDVIGRVDNTGRKTGNHVHYGVYLGGNAIDPLIFQRYNMISQDFSKQEIEEKRRLIEDILNN